jgi:hypothetical protein
MYQNTHYPPENTVSAVPRYARGKRFKRVGNGKRIIKSVKRAGGKRVAAGRCRR